MSDSKQAPQKVRIIITGERSDGTYFAQCGKAKAGDRFEVGEDGYIVRVDNPTDTTEGGRMSELEARYNELVDKVNNSKTRDEHYQWHERLCGFLEGVTACGGNAGHLIMCGDDVQRSRGVDRDMCGGCWLDWEPQTDIDNPTG